MSFLSLGNRPRSFYLSVGLSCHSLLSDDGQHIEKKYKGGRQMKRIMLVAICIFLSICMLGCTGPGTGPGGTYTEADRQRDQTNTALAVGAAAVGAVVVGGAIKESGKSSGPGPAPRAQPAPRR